MDKIPYGTKGANSLCALQKQQNVEICWTKSLFQTVGHQTVLSTATRTTVAQLLYARNKYLLDLIALINNGESRGFMTHRLSCYKFMVTLFAVYTHPSFRCTTVEKSLLIFVYYILMWPLTLNEISFCLLSGNSCVVLGCTMGHF